MQNSTAAGDILHLKRWEIDCSLAKSKQSIPLNEHHISQNSEYIQFIVVYGFVADCDGRLQEIFIFSKALRGIF